MKLAFYVSIAITLTIFIPLILVGIFWVKKGIRFDKRANIVGIYLYSAAVLVFLSIYLAFQSINNTFVTRIFNPLEMFLLGYFLLSFHIKSTINNFLGALILTLIVVAIDLFWGTPKVGPIEQIVYESLILIWLVILTSRKLNYSQPREKAYFYFFLAIGIEEITNFIHALIDYIPIAVILIGTTASLICYLLYARGYYILLKKS